MGVLQWDQNEQKIYHSGISKVILFPNWNVNLKTYTGGVAWNGITSIEESPDGGEANDIWADNVKYGSMRAVENLRGSISAYQYPDALNALDGKLVIDGIAILGQQKRTKRFGLCYRTEIGTDANPDAGYQLHFLYDVMISPSEKSYETITDSPDATEFSWDFECLPQTRTYSYEGWKKLFPNEPLLYEGAEGPLGYEYTWVNSDDEDKSPIKYTGGNRYAVKKLIPENVEAYLHITPAINESFQMLASAYGYETPGDDTSPLISPNLMPTMFDVRSGATTDRYFTLGVIYAPVDSDSDSEVQPEYIGWTIGLGRNSQLAPSVWNEAAEIVVQGMITETYTFSSVVIDSRYTSPNKLQQIVDMIQNEGCSMPTLNELLG